MLARGNKVKEVDSIKSRKARVKAMVDRMAQAYGVQKKDLAEILGCQDNAINNWVYYARTPLTELEQCHHETGASMDWLLLNKSPNHFITPNEKAELKALSDEAINNGIEFNLVQAGCNDGVSLLSGKLITDFLKFLNIEHNPQATALIIPLKK